MQIVWWQQGQPASRRIEDPTAPATSKKKSDKEGNKNRGLLRTRVRQKMQGRYRAERRIREAYSSRPNAAAGKSMDAFAGRTKVITSTNAQSTDTRDMDRFAGIIDRYMGTALSPQMEEMENRMIMNLFPVLEQISLDTALFFFEGFIAFLIVGLCLKNMQGSLIGVVIGGSIYAVCEILEDLTGVPGTNTFTEILTDIVGALALGSAAGYAVSAVILKAKGKGRPDTEERTRRSYRSYRQDE